jgi:hypothetical protein
MTVFHFWKKVGVEVEVKVGVKVGVKIGVSLIASGKHPTSVTWSQKKIITL